MLTHELGMLSMYLIADHLTRGDIPPPTSELVFMRKYHKTYFSSVAVATIRVRSSTGITPYVMHRLMHERNVSIDALFLSMMHNDTRGLFSTQLTMCMSCNAENGRQVR